MTVAAWELRFFCTRPQDSDMWRTLYERLRQDLNVYSVSVHPNAESPHIIDMDVTFMSGEFLPNDKSLLGLDARYPRIERFTHQELDQGIEAARFAHQQAMDEVLAQDLPEWQPPPWVAPGRWVVHKKHGWTARIKEVIHGAVIRVRFVQADARGERAGGMPRFLLASNFIDAFEPAETPRLPKTAYQRLIRGGGL